MTSKVPVADRSYYTTEEVAALVGISATTLREGINDKDPALLALGPLKVRRTISWSKAAVDRWVAGERSAA